MSYLCIHILCGCVWVIGQSVDVDGCRCVGLYVGINVRVNVVLF